MPDNHLAENSATSMNVDELMLLYQACLDIAKADDVARIFQVASDKIRQTALRGAIYVAEEENFRLPKGVSKKGSNTDQLPTQLNVSPKEIEVLLKASAAKIVKDINDADEKFPAELLAMPMAVDCITAAFIPVKTNNQLRALMILCSPDNNEISPARIKPYASFADHIAAMVVKVENQISLLERIDRAEKMSGADQHVGMESDLEKLYPQIHNQIKQSVGEVVFYIALFNAETDHISFPYVYEDGEQQKIDPIPVGDGLTSLVIRNRKPILLVEDAEKKALEMGAKIVGPAAKSWLGVPVMVGTKVIGVMTIQDVDNEQRFNKSDLDLMTKLASQIAGAMDTTRRLDESQKYALQLETAAQIFRETSGTLDKDVLLNKTINLVKDRFDYYHVSIYLLDSAKKFAVIQESTGEAGQGLIDQGHRFKVGSQSVIGHVTASGDPLTVNNVTGDPMHTFDPLLPDTQAVVGIPLIIGKNVIGALDVQSTKAYSFSKNDIKVLQAIAGQLAGAISNAELFTETQENLAQQRLVHHVTTVASAATSLEEALSGAIKEMRVSMANKVAILLFRRDPNLMNIAASAGYEDDILELQIAVGKGITGWVAENQKPLLVNNVLEDSRYIKGSDSIRSELAAPLIYSNELLGVINLESDRLNAFSENDQEVLSTIANSLAAIIVNSRLSERQRQLFEVTNKIRQSADMGTILKTTANELNRVLKTRRAKIEIGLEQLVSEPATDSHSKNGKEEAK